MPETKGHCRPPRVGETVQYLKGGTGRPYPAIVQEVVSQAGLGMVMLKISYTTHFETTNTVIRHIDDPEHLEHEMALKQNGAWRYLE